MAPLNIAILINAYPTPYSPLVSQSFTTAIATSSPGAKITFYDPIHTRQYPSPNTYDLIVLSGGTADPMGNDPWVVEIRNWIRTLVKEHPRQKLLGICWGHQQLCVAFGGVVGMMEGPELGVTSIPLTPLGRDFFPAFAEGRYLIHEYHRREIKQAAEGFVELGEGRQCFVDERNTILSFQGHPELNEGLAKAMLGNSPAYMGISEGEGVEKRMERGHDGGFLWERILEWVRE